MMGHLCQTKAIEDNAMKILFDLCPHVQVDTKDTLLEAVTDIKGMYIFFCFKQTLHTIKCILLKCYTNIIEI